MTSSVTCTSTERTQGQQVMTMIFITLGPIAGLVVARMRGTPASAGAGVWTAAVPSLGRRVGYTRTHARRLAPVDQLRYDGKQLRSRHREAGGAPAHLRLREAAAHGVVDAVQVAPRSVLLQGREAAQQRWATDTGCVWTGEKGSTGWTVCHGVAVNATAAAKRPRQGTTRKE